MDSSISNQLKFLVNENVGVKLESILEQIFQSEIYFFSDILNHRNVQALNIPNESNKIFNTLNLLNKGEFKEYKNYSKKYIELNDKVLQKLKILNLLKLAREMKLSINSQFELDDILITAISNKLINVKVNQLEETLIILSVVGNDCLDDYESSLEKIQNFLNHLDKANNHIENLIKCSQN